MQWESEIPNESIRTLGKAEFAEREPESEPIWCSLAFRSDHSQDGHTSSRRQYSISTDIASC
jgi:hypothetical protein